MGLEPCKGKSNRGGELKVELTKRKSEVEQPSAVEVLRSGPTLPATSPLCDPGQLLSLSGPDSLHERNVSSLLHHSSVSSCPQIVLHIFLKKLIHFENVIAVRTFNMRSLS